MALSRQEEQLDRLEILENEKRLRATTLSQFAQADADTPRGRFTVHEQSRVIGSEPLPRYPQLPASSPWAGPDLVPTEPPLGYAIDELAALEPTPPSAHSPLAVVMSGKATPNPGPASALTAKRAGLGSFSSRTYRRF
jgi:hypothetical protein